MAMAQPDPGPQAPEGAAPDQGAPPSPPQPKASPKEIVANIHDGLMQLMDLFQATQAIPPEDKQKLGAVISGFQSLVDDLGQAPGAAKPAGPPAPGSGPVPMESGGNPNARPM